MRSSTKKFNNTYNHVIEKAVYHLHGNHTVTLYEIHEKIRYHLSVWPLGD